jgi:hypothetical protein
MVQLAADGAGDAEKECQVRKGLAEVRALCEVPSTAQSQEIIQNGNCKKKVCFTGGFVGARFQIHVPSPFLLQGFGCLRAPDLCIVQR